jgi:hypothetical protein
MDTNLNALLEERGKRYGEFTGHAEITIKLKSEIGRAIAKKGRSLQPDQLEALHMIAHNIGRILNGDPNYADSWRDIAGYAQLVADRLDREQLRTSAPETETGSETSLSKFGPCEMPLG